jgi:flavin-binding protein dodecin
MVGLPMKLLLSLLILAPVLLEAGEIDKDHVAHWQVTLKVGFTLE